MNQKKEKASSSSSTTTTKITRVIIINEIIRRNGKSNTLTFKNQFDIKFNLLPFKFDDA